MRDLRHDITIIGVPKLSGLTAVGLGLVPGSRRAVTPVPASIKAMVPPPTDSVITVISSGADPLSDTVPLMKKKIRSTLYQTKKLASHLKGSDLQGSARNDFNLIFKHIAYVKDEAGNEQVRSPRRTIYDGRGDCDCYTVLLSSLLLNQGIEHFIRVAKYSGDWAHVYVIVPWSGKANKIPARRDEYIVVDPVTNRFDHEASYTDKKDFPMKLTSMDGLGECLAPGEKPLIQTLREFVPTTQIIDRGLIPTQDFLEVRKFPYVQHIDGANTEFIVQTPQGDLPVPSVMTKSQAAQVEAAMASAPAEASILKGDTQGTFKWWLVLAAGALSYALFKKKTNPVDGLAGAPPAKATPKRKPRRKSSRRLSTLTI